MGNNEDDSGRPLQVAKGSAIELDELQREADILPDGERGYARAPGVIILTEAVDDPDGGSRVSHAGDNPHVHERLLAERSLIIRHQISEEQRTKRQTAWAACLLVVVSAIIFTFGPHGPPTYISAAVLLVAGGAFGVKSFRLKGKGFELRAGNDQDR